VSTHRGRGLSFGIQCSYEHISFEQYKLEVTANQPAHRVCVPGTIFLRKSSTAPASR
jgi:hypothetical protein